METVFRLKVSELNIDFINAVKSLFKKNREIEISIYPSTDLDLNKPETREEYFTRLNKAMKNVEKGNIIKFTGKEFETFTNNLINE